MKKLLVKVLSVMVVLAVIVASAVSLSNVSAEGDADYILGGITQLLPGTEDKGITDPANLFGQYGEQGIHGTVMLGLPNGDFEQGFKWWAGKQNKAILNSMELVTEGENKYAQFDETKVDRPYEGFATPDIAVPASKLNVGDKLALMLDWKGSDFQLCWSQRNSDVATVRSGGTSLYRDGDWTTGYIELVVGERTAGTTPGYATSDYYTFWLAVENKSTDTEAAFDNFKLAIHKADGKFYDVDTGAVIDTSGPAPTGDAAFVIRDAGKDIVGTETEGITEHYDNFHSYVIKDLQNGDFSKGLKFWGGACEGGPTASGIKLVTEGENKYVQFNNAPANWKGLRSPDIAISEEYIDDGDKLTLIFDYKGSEWQMVLAQRNGGSGRMNQAQESNITILSVNGEWAKVACEVMNPVGARQAGNTYPGYSESGYYTFYIQAENKSTACDAAFDNFELVKVGADGAWYDIYTGEKLAYTEWVPEEEGGGATGGGSTGGSTGGSSTGTGTGGSSSSATTGDSFPVAAVAVAGIAFAAVAVVLKKKVR